MLFYLELPPHTHHHKHTKNSQPGIKRGKQICRQVCEWYYAQRKKKFKPLDENPSFPGLVPDSWFLVPISQRNEIDSATTQQQTPRSNRKIHNEKQRWWRKDTEARNRRSPNQDGNLFEPPIFRQNSVKRETDSERDRKTDTLRQRRNNGCRQGCNAPRIGSSNREKPCPALFKES